MNTEAKEKRLQPTEADRRHLIGMSGGCCNICRLRLFVEGQFGEQARLGDDAHIIAASNAGPRGNDAVSSALKAAAKNLILLCKVCHSKVDQQPIEYSCDRLLEIRNEHYRWVELSLGSIIIEKPKFHYLSYINIPRADMYAVVNSIALPRVQTH
ncbi:hypothetical protein [Pseudotabrizicola alkalilacus]|uniref:hypothetical protein n=1 Tax=Pseudotabrizicola alkalilacus TaxID=2305252 RepID=UPI0013148C69|nr:hypothetical protein [Pseudotabrizicola alkalilacus]